MRSLALMAALSVAAMYEPGLSAWAENPTPVAGSKAPLPMSEPEVQERLKTFDPVAVAAARHYYESPVMKAAMLSRMKGTVAAMKAEFADIMAKQKGLSEADRAKADAENAAMLAAIEKATADNYDYMLGLHMIAALEIFSKDEMIALDNFFSSPVGQGVVKKMPLLNKRIPDVMHLMVPKMVSAMKAKGLDTP